MSEATSALSARAQSTPESPTLAIDAKARALRAQGEDVVGFGAGEPDFPTPAHIVEAAAKAAADERLHHYTAAAGLPELRQAIADKTARDFGFDCDAADVVVTNGGKHALYSTFQALIDPGDEVLLPAPYWVSYPEQIKLAGGTVVAVPATAASGWRVSLEQLEAAHTRHTRALVFTSPSNPTGAVYPPDEVEAIGRWAADTGIWVITDEIYEHLVYGDARHVSMPVVVPELRDRCVIVNGVAKTYAMTGWRVGWAIAPQPVSRALARIQSHTTSNVSNVAQAAAVAAVSGPLDAVDAMRGAYDRRRLIAHAALSAIDGITCPLPDGAFYVFPDVRGVLGRTIGGRPVADDEELAEALLDGVRVAVVPGTGFGAPGCLRLSYALSDQDLTRGLDRLATALTA